eukprot:CAMPEP_0202904966 /NCGR_PEP_ID=MMETSP1392-20130828/31944_1 /ASSEMBLY_ACC=CAM_ASM_000868 /TAXON_ID=225041 /ORGANISM="Chlamydomonas chlamydogama, Strain SAG 11-48b" /LENGTH=268 /DNA_ID=CAMNT_0049592863 /DNA_START=47 /DNA_END=853 /DNA_ORIENTATION=+
MATLQASTLSRGALQRRPVVSARPNVNFSARPSSHSQKAVDISENLINPLGLGVGLRQPARSAQLAPSALPVAVATAGVSLPVAEVAVMGCGVYHLALFLAMIAAPNSISLRSVVKSFGVFVPLALTYGVLLYSSWSPDTLSIMMPGNLAAGLQGFNPQFFPQLEGIITLFGRPMTASSLLVHLMAVNLFLARSIFLDGFFDNMPTRHSIALASFFGPLGLISHAVTKVVLFSNPSNTTRRSAKSGTLIIKSNKGTITLLPYTTAEQE